MEVSRAGRRPWYRREMSARRFAFLLNLPTLLFLGVVLAYPVVYAGYLSVHRVGLAQLRRGEFPFNGWDNYGRVLEDPLFWTMLGAAISLAAIPRNGAVRSEDEPPVEDESVPEAGAAA